MVGCETPVYCTVLHGPCLRRVMLDWSIGLANHCVTCDKLQQWQTGNQLVLTWNGSIKSKGQNDWPNRPNGLVCSFMVTEERAVPSYHAAAMPLLLLTP